MMIACPACDSRYDVDGYARGQRLRCHCGNVFAYEPPAAQAGALSCPHCGGSVTIGDARCTYCASELLLKACPRCMHRVFAGYQHCPQCGVELAVAEARTATEMPCPRCASPLQARLVGDIVIDECGTCQGLFLDSVVLSRVIADRARARAEALFGALPKAETHVAPRPGEKLYLKCPVCHTVMNRRQFATGAGIVIDVCKPHGTFFDAGELPAIIEFVMKGGLEAAAKKELEQARHRLQLERERFLATTTDTSSMHYTQGAALGEAIVDLFTTLLGGL